MKSIALHLRKECKNQKVLCTNFLSSSVFITFFLFLGFSTTAQTSWTVTSTADTGIGTLRTLIVDSASAGDTIRFSSAIDGDTIVLTSGQILLDRDLVIIGNDSSLTKIDGNNNSRIFEVVDTAEVILNDVTLQNGNSADFGGAIKNTGHVFLQRVTVNENQSDRSGGGIHNYGILIVQSCVFAANDPTGTGVGGAILNWGLTEIDSSVFRNNIIKGDGGAIYSDSSLVVRYSSFEGNKAQGGSSDGGAIFQKLGYCSIYSSTFYNNVANDGGAFASHNGYTFIGNSTLSGNTARSGGLGGGIYSGSDTMVLANSTITENKGGKGGGVYVSDAFLKLKSTLIAGNTASNSGPDGFVNTGTLDTSSSHNLIGKNNSFGLNAGNSNIIGTASSPIVPLLDTLADNGGPRLTHALLNCSPAFNTGYSDSLFDQRGIARPQFGLADIGAFESNTDLGTQNRLVTNLNDSGSGSLREAISNSCNTDTIFFDSSLNGDTIVLTTGEIVVDRDIVLSGNGLGSTIIDGNGNDRVFNISGGTKVEIIGIAIQNGFVSSFNNTGAGVNNAGNLNISECEIRGCNTQSAYGGGIYNTGTLSVLNSTLSHNLASNGGAIYSSFGDTCLLTNVTVSSNSALSGCGGIFSLATPTTILNSTITLNGNNLTTAGGIEIQHSPFLIKNSIVAGNHGNQGDLFGLGVHADPSSSYNLVSDTTNFFMPIGKNNVVGTAAQPIDARLDSLKNNGGGTPTHSLRCSSPALNNGNSNLLIDQRGQPRGVGGADDIGAFEYQGISPSPSVRLVTSATDNTPGSLRRIIYEACANDTILFDTTLNTVSLILTKGGILLDIPLVIIGNGPSNTIVDGNSNSDIFKVAPNVSVSIERLQLKRARAYYGLNGSALANHGILTARHLYFYNNYSDEYAGGLSNFAGGVCHISHSLFENNSSSANKGDAIYNVGTLTVRNSTINNENGYWNGIPIQNEQGSLLMDFSTVFNQSSECVKVLGGIFTVHNSILTRAFEKTSYSSPSIHDFCIDVSGSGQLDTLSSHNLVDIDNVLPIGRGNLVGTFSNPLDPLIGPLADNGGLTKTHALLLCSPAINGATEDSLTDQRGGPRGLFGASDIGAFELDVNGVMGKNSLVTSLANDGPGSLREIISLSCSSDTIVFDKSLNGDTILLTGGEIKISSNLTIIGNDADSTIIDGANFKGILDIRNKAVVSIKGLTLQNGKGTGSLGGAITNRGNLKIDSTKIFRNRSGASNSRGAIYNTDSAICHISNSEISYNQGDNSGGAIYNNESVLCTISNCYIFRNEGSSGGGIYNNGTLEVSASQIDSNETQNTRSGGGLANAGKALIIGSTFSGNRVKGNGRGGAINSSGELTLKSSTVDGNLGNGGGSSGGGLHISGYSFIANSSIINNRAGGGGGLSISVSVGGNDSLIIYNSTISGNTAFSSQGGGLTGYEQNVSILNSTIADNHAKRGGGIYYENGTIMIKSSIIAGNTVANIGADGYLSNVNIDTNSSYNLIGINDSFSFPAGNFNKVGTSANALWPGLDSLADNGGPTLTHALLPSSPAFDAGHSDSLTDQRGQPRGAFCRADMGAFESQANLDTTTFATQQVLHCDFWVHPQTLSIWDSSGIYIDSTLNIYGCDSIAFTDFQINSPAYTLIDTFAYHSYTSPSGKHTWTQSGSYKDTVIDSNGCGHVYHINLLMNCDWKAPGFASDAIVATRSAGTTRIVFDNSNTPYIVFRDKIINKARVKSFDGMDWINVGAPGFSAGDVASTDIAVDKSGVLYVAFRDLTLGNKVTVMKYADTNWAVVGSAGISAGGSEYISLVVDTSGVPMVGYRDANHGFRATVQKFNPGTNSWNVLGTAGFSPGGANHIAMATNPAGLPYIVFRDGNTANRRATVMKYNGSNWVLVDTAGFTAGQADFNDIAMDTSGTPYVVYQDNAFENKASVKKLVGSQWQTVGMEGFSPGPVEHTRIALDPSGTPYVVYRDSTSKKASVMTFAQDQWRPVGSPGFSNSGSSFTSIAIDSEGNPMVALTQSGVKAYSYNCVSTSELITACDSVQSPDGGTYLTESGIYRDTAYTSSGHDSIVVVGLTINLSNDTTLLTSACYNYTSPSGLYTWDSTGVYMDTLTNASGCDSVIIVNLILNVTDTALSLSGCDSVVSPSGLYTWYSSGTYSDTLQNVSGCDSLITVNATIQQSSNSSISAVSCYSYTSPSGLHTWDSTGVYMDTLTNASGCDSVITVNLSLNVTDTILSISGCDSVVSPSGLHTWFSSGTYMDTLRNINGCESLITANVNITPCPVDCQMSGWSAWSACDTICGGGLRIRTRNILVAAAYGGLACGDTIEYDTCNTQPCCTTTNTFFTDSICPGDSLFVANAWQTAIGTYVDSAVSVLGCDSLLHTSLYFKDSSSCIVDSTVETILYLVSDSAWTRSTVVTVETSNSYPWPGAVAYLPHDSTFTLPVEVGQPYSWTHLYTVMGSEVITSRSGVTYYRYQFDLTEHETLNARFRMFVDDNMQIFINRNEIALEDDMGKVNWRTANHDLLFDDTGAIFNGYNGGDPFDYYTLTNLDSVFQTGANDIILAIRNRTSKPDIGGFSFRMDLDKAGKAVIVKKDEEITMGATSLGIVVYPNPTTGWLQVHLINGQDEGTLNVLDVAGRLLMQKRMSQSTELNLESFSQGVYLVRVTSGGRSYTVRVVKN